MFQEWGFLISEMVLLIILAALLGLFVGWIVWGRRSDVSSGATDQAQADLEACRADVAKKDDQIAALEGRVAEAEALAETAEEVAVAAATEASAAADAATSAAHAEDDAKIHQLEDELEAARAEALAAEKAAMQAAAEVVPVAEAVAADHGAHPIHADGGAQDFDGDGVIEGGDEGTKPASLEEPREGGPDDLKQIKGIGPKLEELCHFLGYFHFDQIASWTPDEVAWVDANLPGFRGRVSRDNWVEQAKALAAGETTEFAQRVKDGDVYD